MIQINNPQKKDWQQILKRPTKTVEDIEGTVAEIFEEVQRNGDDAISKYTTKFDNINIKEFCVSNLEIEKATSKVSNELKESIFLAKRNIETFHTAQKTNKVSIKTTPGVVCWQEQHGCVVLQKYIRQEVFRLLRQ